MSDQSSSPKCLNDHVHEIVQSLVSQLATTEKECAMYKKESEKLKDENAILKIENEQLNEKMEKLNIDKTVSRSEEKSDFPADSLIAAEEKEMKESMNAVFEKTAQLHKKLTELESAKKTAKSLQECQAISKEICQIEDLLVKLIDGLKLTNQKNVKAIEDYFMKNISTNVHNDVPSFSPVAEMLAQNLVGTWDSQAPREASMPKSLIISKNQNGFYTAVHSFESHASTFIWKPDGVVREGTSVSLIDANLSMRLKHQTVEFIKTGEDSMMLKGKFSYDPREFIGHYVRHQ